MKNKGKYGMDARTVWFVVETREDQVELSWKYPGRILLCDRSFIPDTYNKKSINNTMSLHKVRSTATSVPTSHPHKWPATVSYLPCNCRHCIQNPDSNHCIYNDWQKSHPGSIQIRTLGLEEAPILSVWNGLYKLAMAAQECVITEN